MIIFFFLQTFILLYCFYQFFHTSREYHNLSKDSANSLSLKDKSHFFRTASIMAFVGECTMIFSYWYVHAHSAISVMHFIPYLNLPDELYPYLLVVFLALIPALLLSEIAYCILCHGKTDDLERKKHYKKKIFQYCIFLAINIGIILIGAFAREVQIRISNPNPPPLK